MVPDSYRETVPKNKETTSVPLDGQLSKITANFASEGPNNFQNSSKVPPINVGGGINYQPGPSQPYNQGPGTFNSYGGSSNFNQIPPAQPQGNLQASLQPPGTFGYPSQNFGQSMQNPQPQYPQQGGSVPSTQGGILSNFNNQLGSFTTPSIYAGQQQQSTNPYYSSDFIPLLPKKRIIEDRLVFEDEFIKVTSFMAKPLVEVEGKLQLRVHVITLNKTSMPINYFYPRYFGPKSRPDSYQTSGFHPKNPNSQSRTQRAITW